MQWQTFQGDGANFAAGLGTAFHIFEKPNLCKQRVTVNNRRAPSHAMVQLLCNIATTGQARRTELPPEIIFLINAATSWWSCALSLSMAALS